MQLCNHSPTEVTEWLTVIAHVLLKSNYISLSVETFPCSKFSQLINNQHILLITVPTIKILSQLINNFQKVKPKRNVYC